MGNVYVRAVVRALGVVGIVFLCEEALWHHQYGGLAVVVLVATIAFARMLGFDKQGGTSLPLTSLIALAVAVLMIGLGALLIAREIAAPNTSIVYIGLLLLGICFFVFIVVLGAVAMSRLRAAAKPDRHTPTDMR
jgi:hypothetical protein